MGILQRIKEQKEKIKQGFEERARAKSQERTVKLAVLRDKNEELQNRVNVRDELRKEEQKHNELQYSGIKNVFQGISQGLKQAQKNKRKSGVLFGKGLSKKKDLTNDRFSNTSIFSNTPKKPTQKRQKQIIIKL